VMKRGHPETKAVQPTMGNVARKESGKADRAQNLPPSLLHSNEPNITLTTGLSQHRSVYFESILNLFLAVFRLTGVWRWHLIWL
jgi:hypothetical protein